MQRREFFRLVGAGAAGAVLAGPFALSGCSRGAPTGSAPSDPGADSADDGLHVVRQPAQISFHSSTDVLVAGSGIAGLSAALMAASAGLRVTVAEKQDVLGGDSVGAVGLMYVSGTSVQQAGVPADEDACAGAWKSREAALKAAGVSDTAFAKTLYVAATEWANLVADECGSQFADPASYNEEGLGQEMLLPKLGLGDMASVLSPVRDRLVALKAQMLTSCEVVALIVDGSGSVRGARVVYPKSGTVEDIEAKRVVIATGGFCSSQPLMHEHAPGWERLGSYTTASMGQGQLLCAACGAQLAGMQDAVGLLGDVPTVNAWGLFAPVLQVDALGRRFASESSPAAAATACFAGGLGYWWTVYDNQLMKSSQARSVAEVTAKNAPRLIGPFDDADGLALAMGLGEGALDAAFRSAQAAADSGKDADFGKKTQLKALEGPFYAFKQLPVRARTRGGVKTDEQGRPVGNVGAALGNLYVCGSAAQGGGDLASNGAFGMIVGRAVVDSLSGEGAAGADEPADADAQGASDGETQGADAPAESAE